MCQKIDDTKTEAVVNVKCNQYKSTYNETDNVEELKCEECNQTGAVGYYKLSNLATSVTYEEVTHTLTKPTQCKIIDLRPKFIDSTLKCKRCNDDYYLNKFGECILRKNTNCKGFVPHDEDHCLKCNVEFYLALDKSCKAIPVANCNHYDPLTQLCT